MVRSHVIHILNGQVMYDHFKKTNFLKQDLMIPFNEAMCFGDSCEEIFSTDFTKIRASVHHVTPEQYTSITIEPLSPLLKEKPNQIELWFDRDMFCQINILTILGWLDFVEYKGDIVLHIVDDRFVEIDQYNLSTEGFYALYKQVLIRKTSPKDVYPQPLKKGIQLYLNFLKEDSNLMQYIKEHLYLPEKELVTQLIQTFRNYGLGDTQYIDIIQSYRKKSR